MSCSTWRVRSLITGFTWGGMDPVSAQWLSTQQSTNKMVAQISMAEVKDHRIKIREPPVERFSLSRFEFNRFIPHTTPVQPVRQFELVDPYGTAAALSGDC
ncbi:hypothetical protein CALCODRAFT_497067 [Calocera cornea HHB12733]|uniref:Uncharacterized protein n=1 Tax=Calocera cornea HHB12733 TaxID=1353952 RepID=A0A165FH82_9BASI|nr:hypothetical protein CALCODRAFT_497067 [Calocera cornea HHB12733]